MDVILLEKVGRLGSLGDRVVVKGGYARNFLLPQGKAVLATDTNVAEFEARRAELEQAQQGLLDAATARADALSGKSVVVTAKAGDEGKLFGSIGTRDIAEAASAQGITLDKSEVRLPEGPLRMIGNHDVTVQLHADVMTTIVVTVTGE
ncbi:MAG: 50S ribosomal protein L9 [Litorivicinaceae bacterium]|jgi:large subunit ribosomal protein L9|nr:50S ribosomal protein L9 [Litorivicinaceae bacterium]MDP5328967.1 50S ribosomal protein L9 [Litorivicinaceae bacterium]MDP5330743.1 50S ribosomal protein L9 [Litorivicinaceae bacterium]MDP5342266.1 50S ribosomal protein L9 [Litorivicinaceae bacterium]MDP5343603.1 50S ribosomal protein L9 [Litorivicinaceae bacterium]